MAFQDTTSKKCKQSYPLACVPRTKLNRRFLMWKATQEKKFLKQVEFVIVISFKNGSESSEVTCSDSYCGQSFHMSNRYFSQRMPSGVSLFMFSYSGHFFVFSLLQESIPRTHTLPSVRLANCATLCSVPLLVQLLQALDSQRQLNWPLDYSV